MIFPGLLVLVSLLGILGKWATQPLITNLGNAAPASVRKIILTDVTHLQHSHAAAGILGIAGILLALWSASNYVAAFMRASNVNYDVPEGRPIWKTRADPPGRHVGYDDLARGLGRHRVGAGRAPAQKIGNVLSAVRKR